VLTLLPLPLELVELPALFFLCTFLILQAAAGVPAIVEIAAAAGTGAVLCLALRRPMAW
jgi:hypothetical protein